MDLLLNLSNKDVTVICEKLIFHSTESLNGGDIPKANAAFKFAIKKICEIIKNKQFDSFFELLFYDNPIVQEVMSLFLLPINKRLAMKRLQRLRLGKSSVCNAAMLIQEYKKRRLKFPMLVEDKVVYVSKEKFLDQLEDKDIEYMESILKERKFI